MKVLRIFTSLMVASLMATSAVAANKVSQEQREDAEYMMRKVVEDIHSRKLTTAVTDTTLDKSIQVLAEPVKFSSQVKDNKTGEIFSCAQVALKTKLRVGKKVKEQIKRTDEICTSNSTGTVRYVRNFK